MEGWDKGIIYERGADGRGRLVQEREECVDRERWRPFPWETFPERIRHQKL